MALLVHHKGKKGRLLFLHRLRKGQDHISTDRVIAVVRAVSYELC